MTSTVARLRARLDEWPTMVHESPSATRLIDACRDVLPHIPALLDVVERLAASDPMDWEMKQNRYPVCRICGAAIQSLDDHLPRCQWVAARRLCGLGGDA